MLLGMCYIIIIAGKLTYGMPAPVEGEITIFTGETIEGVGNVTVLQLSYVLTVFFSVLATGQ